LHKYITEKGIIELITKYECPTMEEILKLMYSWPVRKQKIYYDEHKILDGRNCRINMLTFCVFVDNELIIYLDVHSNYIHKYNIPLKSNAIKNKYINDLKNNKIIIPFDINKTNEIETCGYGYFLKKLFIELKNYNIDEYFIIFCLPGIRTHIQNIKTNLKEEHYSELIKLNILPKTIIIDTEVLCRNNTIDIFPLKK
jgi:hypothetical protein